MKDNTQETTSEKMQFLYKLIPPRATFAMDMTDEEQDIMKAHADYWIDLTEKGTAILFGPVLDPNGVWGLAIMEVEDETQARTIATNDPSITARLNTFGLYPMKVSKIRKEILNPKLESIR